MGAGVCDSVFAGVHKYILMAIYPFQLPQFSTIEIYIVEKIRTVMMLKESNDIEIKRDTSNVKIAMKWSQKQRPMTSLDLHMEITWMQYEFLRSDLHLLQISSDRLQA